MTSDDRRARLAIGSPDQPQEAVLRLLDNTPIRIAVTTDPTPSQRLLATVLADALGRVHPVIEARTDEADLEQAIRAAATHGGLPTSDAGQGRPVTVAVGRLDDDSAHLHVDAAGWHTYLGTRPSQLARDASGFPVGAMLAAARAAAHTSEVVAPSAGAPRTPTSTYSSALTLQSRDAPPPAEAVTAMTDVTFDIDWIMAGLGSVGGAAVLLLGHLPHLSGRIVLADPQNALRKNVDRALLITAENAAAEPFKAQLAADMLARPGLIAVPHVGTLGHWLASGPARPLPMVLCAVDTLEARRAVQDCLPLHLVNGACDARHTDVSVHETGNGPCMCCLHMDDIDRPLPRLIADLTGIHYRTVAVAIDMRRPFGPAELRQFERGLDLPQGALNGHAHRPPDELWRVQQGIYGRRNIAGAGPAGASVAAPAVTALTGFRMAAEALKLQLVAPDITHLGPLGNHVQLSERADASPEHLQLLSPTRWTPRPPTEPGGTPGPDCLCNSTRRSRLLRQRYGLPNSAPS